LVRPGRDKVLRASQAVGNSTGQDSGAPSGFNIGIPVPNHQRIRSTNAKVLQSMVQQGRVWFFLRCAVTAEDRIKLLFDTQAAQHRYRKPL
jgi:hypothetical protein